MLVQFITLLSLWWELLFHSVFGWFRFRGHSCLRSPLSTLCGELLTSTLVSVDRQEISEHVNKKHPVGVSMCGQSSMNNIIKILLIAIVVLFPSITFADENEAASISGSVATFYAGDFDFDTTLNSGSNIAISLVRSATYPSYGTSSEASILHNLGSHTLCDTIDPFPLLTCNNFTITWDFSAESIPDGDFWVYIVNNGWGISDDQISYYQFNKSGSVYTYNGNSFIDNTHIISVDPIDNSSVATGTPVTISTDIYINQNDITEDTILRQTVELTNAPVLGNIWGGTGDFVTQQAQTLVYEYDIDSEGFFTFSTTTTFSQIGERTLTTEIINDVGFFQEIIYGDDIVVSSSTSFLVGTTTSGDLITQSISDSLVGLSATGSTTIDTLSVACSPFSGNFDIVLCAYRMVVPDSQTANALFQETYEMVFTRAPFGYFTDFISIMSTSTVGSLTVIDATLPAGVAGAGSHITLDLTNVLDDFLNATTGSFINESASSTKTFYEITSYYWNIIINILFVLYAMRRLLGSHIIPHNEFGKHGALDDTNSSDDSYRLKEYLYNHRNERHK